jgi:hypothetical protein
MDIIFTGKHTDKEAAESIERVLKLFKERYNISQFREIHLVVTLVDRQGDDVELIDSETQQAYRSFEVYRQGFELEQRIGVPYLKLVVNNT